MKPRHRARARVISRETWHRASVHVLMFLATLFVAMLAWHSARAEETMILTLEQADGAVAPVSYTMDQLDAMPQAEITTKTPWYDEAHTFSGPRLTDVLAAAKMSGETITATALNDYAADLPVADAAAYNVILATRLDGAPMPLRDKGPIFIIYPYDTSAALQHDVYYTRSVWQLQRLTLK
jgi:hypothetical protein